MVWAWIQKKTGVGVCVMPRRQHNRLWACASTVAQSDKQISSNADKFRPTYMQGDTQTEAYTVRYIDKQAHRLAHRRTKNRQIHIHCYAEVQTDRQVGKRASRQTDGQTDMQPETDRDRGRQAGSDRYTGMQLDIEREASTCTLIHRLAITY